MLVVVVGGEPAAEISLTPLPIWLLASQWRRRRPILARPAAASLVRDIIQVAPGAPTGSLDWIGARVP